MTSQVIVPLRARPHTGAMNLRRFLLLDSFALDAAGVVALLAGATTLGIVLLVLAGVVFVTWLAAAPGRRTASPS
jgi:hypothetical protein